LTIALYDEQTGESRNYDVLCARCGADDDWSHDLQLFECPAAPIPILALCSTCEQERN